MCYCICYIFIINYYYKAKKAGLIKDSVFEAKLNTNKYSESKFHRDALLGFTINYDISLYLNYYYYNTVIYINKALERCAGDVITDMLYIVENYDPDDAQMQLVMRGG